MWNIVKRWESDPIEWVYLWLGQSSKQSSSHFLEQNAGSSRGISTHHLQTRLRHNTTVPKTLAHLFQPSGIPWYCWPYSIRKHHEKHSRNDGQNPIRRWIKYQPQDQISTLFIDLLRFAKKMVHSKSMSKKNNGIPEWLAGVWTAHLEDHHPNPLVLSGINKPGR